MKPPSFTRIICKAAEKQVMWLALKFAAVYPIFGNIFPYNLITNQTIFEVVLKSSHQVDRILFKSLSLILWQHDNSAPCGQAWKMFLSHQSYAGINYKFGLLRLATSAGVQNLQQSSKFTYKILQSFWNLHQRNCPMWKAHKLFSYSLVNDCSGHLHFYNPHTHTHTHLSIH